MTKTETKTETKTSTRAGWVVYHGGALFGLGRWSGPHRTRREAEASARECRQVAGGEPTVERADS